MAVAVERDRLARVAADGLAANLLIKRLGGPVALTARFREMGDTVTRLDRYEPDLGLVRSGDLRDTTSPLAMAQLVRRTTTGTGRAEGTTNKCNDVAITFPTTRSPIIVAAYFGSGEYTAQVEARHETVVAEVGRIAAAWATSQRSVRTPSTTHPVRSLRRPLRIRLHPVALQSSPRARRNDSNRHPPWVRRSHWPPPCSSR